MATLIIEAEYIAISVYIKQSQFLVALLRELGCPKLVGECSFQPLVKADYNTVRELRLVQLKGDN